MSIKCLILWIP